MVKNLPANARDIRDVAQVLSLSQEDPLEAMQPTLVLLAGEIHGQRNLVGSGPYSRKESDMTKVT